MCPSILAAGLGQTQEVSLPGFPGLRVEVEPEWGSGPFPRRGVAPSLWLLWPCLPWTLGHERAPVVSQWKLTGLPPPLPG